MPNHPLVPGLALASLQMLVASGIITVLSASMLKIAHMREKWERKLQVRHGMHVVPPCPAAWGDG